MMDYSPPISDTTPGPDGNWHMLQFDGSVWPANPGEKMGFGYALTRPPGPVVTDSSEIAVAPPTPRSLEHLVPLATGSISGGPGTNNEAEYKALIAGLGHALRIGVRRINIVGDSQLVLFQTKGDWRCKSKKLQPLCSEARALVACFSRVAFKFLKRDFNERCDDLAKRAACELAVPGHHHLVGPTGLTVGDEGRWITDKQAALIRWCYVTRGLRPAYISRAFVVDPAVASRVGRGETHKYIKEEHLHCID